MSDKNKQYVKNPDFVYRKIVDEVILIPIHKQVADMDCIYTLNSVGASIWQLLDQTNNKAALLTALLDEYDTSSDTISADLDSFLEEMLTIGAIRRID